jgi:zinc/manganese transport system substrate-binding protein
MKGKNRSRSRLWAILGAFTVSGLALGGCAGSTSSGHSGRLTVVATTTQLGDLVRQIGGDAVDVTQLLRPNTDPHDYEPRPDDILHTAGARLVVVNGDRLDQWMTKVISNAGGNPVVLDAGAGRPDALPGQRTGPEASRFDPHWWHDPTNMIYAAKRVRDALIRINPKVRQQLDRNTSAYIAKLHELDARIVGCMRQVPATQRKLVTDHDAFNYFAHRYAITVVGAVIPSQTTQAQPSAGSVARLAELIKREHVKAIFPESSVNHKLARAIAAQTGATANRTLYGDTLGLPSSPGGTYLGMEQANADAMVQGFTAGQRRCDG